VEPGQHDIDHRGIVGAPQRALQSVAAVIRVIDGKARFLQPLDDKGRDFFYRLRRRARAWQRESNEWLPARTRTQLPPTRLALRKRKSKTARPGRRPRG